MNDQKIENILNLALDATENERERSGQLVWVLTRWITNGS